MSWYESQGYGSTPSYESQGYGSTPSYSGTYGRLSNEEARQAEWAASAAAEADNKRRQEELDKKMNELGFAKADIIAFGRIIEWNRVTKEIKNNLEQRRAKAMAQLGPLQAGLNWSELERVDKWATEDSTRYNQLIAEPAITQLIDEAMAEEEAARKAAANAAAEEAEAQRLETEERADNTRRLAMSQQQQEKKSSWFGFGSRPTPVVTRGTPKPSMFSRWFGTKKSGGSKGRKSSSSKKTRRSRR